jgi:hypothetical protein
VIPNNTEKIPSTTKSIVLDMDSHVFIERLTNQSSPTYLDLKKKGFPGYFDFVYLDYCGTWNSKSGKRRKRDIERLSHYGLVSNCCVLALTASQRGSAEIYLGQIADEMVLYTMGTFPKTSRLLSVMSYKNTCKIRCDEMYTSSSSSKSSSMITVAFHLTDLTDNILNNNITPHPNIRFCSGHHWKPQIENIKDVENTIQWTPLSHAVQRAACRFANCVTPALPTNILVQDAPMLVTTHFIHQILPKSHVLAVVSTKSTAVSKTLASRSTHIKVEFRRVLHVFDDFDNTPSKTPIFKAIWFGHSQQRVFSIRELERCHEWPSLNAVLRKRLVDPKHGVLAIYFGYPSTGMCWRDSAIDYVVSGVERASLKFGYTKPRVVYVSRFCVTHPRAVVIFKYGTDDDREKIFDDYKLKKMPKDFTDQDSCWDWRKRFKIASPNSKKYRICVPYLVSLLQHFQCVRAFLYEPGGFFVAPALMKSMKHDVKICTRGDFVQYQEFISRDHHNGEVRLDCEDVSNLDAMIVLEESSSREFQDRWGNMLEKWISSYLVRPSILFVMSRSDNHDWLSSSLIVLPSSCVLLEVATITSMGFKYCVSVFLVYNPAHSSSATLLLKTWAVLLSTRPKLRSIQGCKVTFPRRTSF